MSENKLKMLKSKMWQCQKLVNEEKKKIAQNKLLESLGIVLGIVHIAQGETAIEHACRVCAALEKKGYQIKKMR